MIRRVLFAPAYLAGVGLGISIGLVDEVVGLIFRRSR